MDRINTFQKKILHLLGSYLSESQKEDIQDPNNLSLEEINGFYYFEVVFTAIEKLSHILLFVFNEKEDIIADISLFATSGNAYLTSTKIYDYLSEESDWLFLEHYLIGNMRYGTMNYPACQSDGSGYLEEFGQDALFFVQSAYVTKKYRKQHLFTNMLDMILDNASQSISLDLLHCFMILSLDPDIACYGPDKKEEPYFYSLEQDEPKRNLNKQILKKMGFEIMEMDPGVESRDGCKIWFAIRAIDYVTDSKSVVA